ILDFLVINNNENLFNPVINILIIALVMLIIVIIFASYKFFDSLISNNKEFIFYAPLLAIPIYCVFFGFITTIFFWGETYALFNSDNGYVVERGNDIKVYYKGKLVNVANAIHFKSYKESFENGVFKIDFFDKEDKILMQVFCGENNERSCRVEGR
ncbi:hypothetical protein L8X52_08130, partial [Campylobacter lari]|nr:hypothetical protein [Campylobacter lari]